MAAIINDLEELDDWCWAQFGRAVHDRHSEYRWLNLATVDAQHLPHVRTVVLRDVDRGARRLTFHTDQRSRKLVELGNYDAVALHVHDRRRAVQIRLVGTASISSQEDRQAAWQRLHDGAKATYAQPVAPGAELSSPADNMADGPLVSEDAYANFAVVDVLISGMDWLELGRDGHRRALFSYATCGAREAAWIAP